MKRVLFFAGLLAVILLSSCKDKEEKGFTLTGKIEGLEAGKKVALIALDFDLNRSTLDTAYQAISTEGGFDIKGVAPDSFMAYRIVFEGEKNQRYPMIFLENKKIEVTGFLDRLRDVEITGSPINAEFNRLFQPFIQADRKYAEANNILRSIDRLDTTRLQSAMDSLRSVMDDMERIIIDVPKGNPTSDFSPFIILVTTRNQRNEFLDVYRSFTPEVQQSYYGKILFSRLPKDFIGTKVLDMNLKDRSGTPVSLLSNLGEYTLILFWASSNTPCRNEMIHMKSLYEQYHDKGLNIYAISVDNDSLTWIKTLDEELLPWINVRDSTTEHSTVAHYEVEYIPHIIMVNKEGNITENRPDDDKIDSVLKSYFEQKQ